MGRFGLILLVLISFIAAAALVSIAGAWYQRIGKTREARLYPPPGRLIEAGGARLHLDSRGEGSPPVVFEAGIAATSLSWQLVQPEISKLTQTASYDRAGLGWSDACAKPRGIWQVVEEMRALLDRGGIPVPRVFVAHSYGGLVASAYAARYPAEVAGMVLVDPADASEWRDPPASSRRLLRLGIRLSRRGVLLARLGVVRFALARLTGGARILPKYIARVSGQRGASLIDRLVGQIQKLPRELWPIIQSHWCDPKCFEAMACYLEALHESAVEAARESFAHPHNIPVIVLSAERATAAERAEHYNLASRFPQARVEIVSASGHWIQMDRPDAVIDAILEIIARCRTQSAGA